ncbi:SPOR domain-containing protein [Undibacterium sp. Ji22W]|uniref:SPOR domain-containing protein n=1 Tax=Undibacterium sp. Ji22W TaxID=3413038 RepID=UPI003BF0DFBA
MSLDSLFKQNNKKKVDTDFTDDSVSGEFRSRSEEESLAAAESPGRNKAAKTGKRTNASGNSRKNSSDDLALPEKKRARRRLIGAVALVLAAVIGLPMVFDSEPKQGTSKIAIEIPAKDAAPGALQDVIQGTIQASAAEKVALNNQTATANQTQDAGLNQGIDKSEEIITTPVSASIAAHADKSVKDERAIAKVDTGIKVPVTIPEKTQEKNSDRKSDLGIGSKNAATTQAVTTNKVVSEPAKKPEVKVEPKTETKKNETIDDAARALALLEGRSLPEPVKAVAKLNKTDGAAGSFVVQVAALNSASKVRELQTKLKAANIQSYTQKIITKTGEVSRIRVGPFSSKAEAEKMRAKLVKIGLNGSLVPT